MEAIPQRRIDAELYRHLFTGNIDGLNQSIQTKQVELIELRHAKDKNTVLHLAAMFNQAHLIIQILSKCPQLMVEPNSKNDLAIHSAMKSGKISAVKALISWSSSAEEILRWKNNRGNTVLHIALENDEVEIAYELVELYPPALFVMNEEKVTPLYVAVKKGFVDVVQLTLMMQPFEDVYRSFKEGKSLLHAAIAVENIEILEHILNSGLELHDSLDEEGRTPLSYAAYIGSPAKAKLLLQAFPDSVFLSNTDGSFPVHQAVLRANIQIIDLLESTKNLLNAKGQNLLHLATQIHDSNVISHLLAIPNIDPLINEKDEDGNTPFQLATIAQNTVIIDILAQDERVKDSRKKSLPISSELYRLLVNGNVDRVSELVANKGYHLKDLRCPQDNSTVLHIAANMEERYMVDELFIRGCAMLLWQDNDKGDLPLHLAASAGKFEALLGFVSVLDGSEDVCRIPDRDGNTALHLACLKGHQRIAEYLFDRCPQAVYCLNKDKMSPLFLVIANAQWNNHPLVDKMIDELKESHIRSFLKDAKSIVHVAILKEYPCPCTNSKRQNIKRMGTEVICCSKSGHTADTLEKIIDKFPTLASWSFDTKGRSPLSYAAHLGCVKQVNLLLQKFPDLAFARDRDEDGSFPIHQASRGGHKKVVELLFSTRRLLNGEGQNILHVAAKTGRSDLVKYLLQIGEFRELINVPDRNGNTALHLAVKGFHAKVVYRLTREKLINPNLMNNDLQRPLDFVELDIDISSSDNDLLVDKAATEFILVGAKGQTFSLNKQGKTRNRWSMDRSSTKALLQTNLMIATVIMTITFAAAFAPPGGYIQIGVSDLIKANANAPAPNVVSNDMAGKAVLNKVGDFTDFEICNGSAFFMAQMSVVVAIYGLYGLPQFMKLALRPSALLLINAIYFMGSAFINGINTTVIQDSSLSYAMIMLGAVNSLIYVVIIDPMAEPSFKNRWYKRCCLFIPNKLLLRLGRKEEPLHLAI